MKLDGKKMKSANSIQRVDRVSDAKRDSSQLSPGALLAASARGLGARVAEVCNGYFTADLLEMGDIRLVVVVLRGSRRQRGLCGAGRGRRAVEAVWKGKKNAGTTD
ncbi:hypothetical protein CERSUDRAFT_101566 [Gelatoporia subvermispora B]|uniref:Uncharacterized protein n=1 Tax=Ceriporiopsis subvermispora (strain B) TaxID=914234 RepID=M2QE66_CERS8|nr:hypothetical protein CERSUDRAFT_101566 [Gelatoporia subvermispora B]